MKALKKYVLMFVFIGLAQISYAGVTIGCDAYFTTSFFNNVSNVVNTTGSTGWIGKDTTLYLGLYPILKADGVSGYARVFANSQAYNNIYFGGANVTGFTKDEKFSVTMFAMSPSFAMTDPMATGARYGSGATMTVISMPTHFVNGKTMYPTIYDSTWMYEENSYLGGNRGVGGYSKLMIGNNVLQLEDFACWNLNNYDSFGLMLKLNPLDIAGVISISAGVTAETLKYKSTQDFSEYNGYYLFDSVKMLPTQTKLVNEDAYLAYGGYINCNLLKMVDIFAQVKSTEIRGRVSNPDNARYIGGIDLYAGAFSSIWDDAMMFEVDFALKTGESSTNIITGTRNMMSLKAKAYGDMDFEVFGMMLKYLVEASYINYQDQLTGFDRYEYIDFGTASYSNVSGIDVKASFKYSLFWMFTIKEMVRYSSVSFVNPGNYDLSQLESRTYLEIDLEDVTPGLWIIGGVRINNYTITTTETGLSAGTASYILPNVEIKYVFGEDSFARITFGHSEFFGVLAQAYGIGYDAIKFADANFSYDENGYLINAADYLMQHNTTINLQFGFKL